MGTPAVSVVMAVRDGAAWLDEAVQSLRAQTLTDFELIVIDDGSQDASRTILSALAQEDRRIRLLRQEPSGLVAALNRGLGEARADFVARLDADDRAAPNRLERQMHYLETNAAVGLLGSRAYTIDAQGRRTGSREPPTDADELRAVLERTNPFIHSSIMLRTALARRLGGYREAFAGAEDDDLWLRISEVTTFANLPEYLVDYREHAAGRESARMLRQAFSARLARRSAALRRSTGSDPAASLSSPPDWHASGAHETFYAEIASLYRALDRRDASGEVLARELPRHALTPAERTLAGRAIRKALTSAEAGARRGLLRFLSRHPHVALKTLWNSCRPFAGA